MNLFKRHPTPRYVVETTDTKLRIIRTHLAAQAGELSNLLTQLGMVRALVSEVRDQLTQMNDKAFPVAKWIGANGACGVEGHPAQSHLCRVAGSPVSSEVANGGA